MNRLTPRERTLLTIVLAVLFLLGNFFIVSTLMQRYRQIQAETTRKREELKTLRGMFSEKDIWAKRDAWLTAKQPKLANRDQARVILLEEVRNAARARNVVLENPALGTVDAQAGYQSVSVDIETKSSWKDLIDFMAGLQQPEKFIVFERSNLQIDTTDPTKMRGRFRIAKWYAP